MNNARINAAAKAQKVPPFLKKLVDLTNSCPPHIGGWSEDGSHFVVRSSQFADLLREQFQGTLQTFVRQLHFYSFNKKDDVSTGMWTFSHPHFLRGQPHLLVNIGRKSNPKRKKNSKGEDDDDDKDSASEHTVSAVAANQAIEHRLIHLERQMTRMNALEREVQALKQELIQLKELGVARDLLSLAPGISTRKRAADESSTSGDKNSTIIMNVQMQQQQQSMTKTLDKDDMLSLLPPPLKKVNRMTSVDSAFELKDFPFEDTSSLGSVSVRDLMRELQYGIFSDFDEFIPVASKFTGSETVIPSTPMSDSSSAEAASAAGSIAGGACGGNKEDFFKIPTGFVLQPGVTMSLLRSTFNVIAKLCCPNNNGHEGPNSLRKLCDDLPHPSTLPPVENCEISAALLPILRDGVEEKASDIALMRSARQVYEVYYGCVMKKLQEKGCAIPRVAGAGVPAAPQLQQQRSI